MAIAMSPPIGNRGKLDIDTGCDDLDCSRPSALTEKPFGLWLALSFDETSAGLLESPPKQKEPVSKPKKLRSGRNVSGPPMELRSRKSKSIGRDGQTSGITPQGSVKYTARVKLDEVEGGPEGFVGTLPQLIELLSPSASDVDLSIDWSNTHSMQDAGSLITAIPALAPYRVGVHQLALEFPSTLFLRHTSFVHVVSSARLRPGTLYGPLRPRRKGVMVPQLLAWADSVQYEENGNMSGRYRNGRPLDVRPATPSTISDMTTGVPQNAVSSIKDVITATSAIGSCPSVSDLESDKKKSVSRRYTIALESPLHHGRLWQSFRAHLVLPLAITRVIFKITCPVLYPDYPSDETYTEVQARRAILREDVLYKTALSDLQGVVVPRSYGLWGGILDVDTRWKSEREVWAIVMEDCGRALEVTTMSPADKAQIIGHYSKLHSKGVIHNDVDPRHWVSHPEGGMRIIDFDSALCLSDPSVHLNGHKGSKRVSGSVSRMRRLAREEMKTVRRCLGLCE